METERRRSGAPLISQRFAVIVIAILFGASATGWIATELVPRDFVERSSDYAERWGALTVRLVHFLGLYDAFHSVWYRAALSLFAVVLLLCIVTRWRQFILRSFSVEPPGEAHELRARELSAELSWRSLIGGERGARDPLIRYAERYGRPEAIGPAALKQAVSRVLAALRGKRLHVVAAEREGGVAFAAASGRWRSPGNFLFHAGILAVTIGGIAGSFAGWRETIYVREGATEPLPPDSLLRLRVEDFEIARTDRMEVKEFLSTVSIIGADGAVRSTGVIAVNRPLKVDGRRLYQSSYYVDETTFRYARVRYALRGSIRTGFLDLAPGVEAPVEGTSISIAAGRFFPDFRMSREGPYSASPLPSNPALEVEVTSNGETERGFLFLYHPDFDRKYAAPVDLAIVHLEPIFYTGLEVSSNPAAPVLLIGFLIATAGLALMYLSNPRAVKGFASAETLLIAATAYRSRASFEREFEGIVSAVRRAAASGGDER